MSDVYLMHDIEGSKDCRHYTGFVGVRLDRRTGQFYGVMHCAWHEYLNAICGAASKIGGIPTYRCWPCRHYEEKQRAAKGGGVNRTPETPETTGTGASSRETFIGRGFVPSVSSVPSVPSNQP